MGHPNLDLLGILLLVFLECMFFTGVVAPQAYGTKDGYHGHGNAKNITITPRIINIADKYKIWPVITAWVNVSYFRKEDQRVVISTEEIGRYGTGPVNSFSGYVSTTVPIDGCTSIQNRDETSDKPWVALFKRGGCPFFRKAGHAIDAGASGFIVYNYYGDITTMDIEDTGVNGVMIPHDYADVIKKAIRHSSQVWVDISMGKDMTPVASGGAVLPQAKIYVSVILTFMVWLQVDPEIF